MSEDNPLPFETALDLIALESSRLAAAVERGEATARVPSCPDWSLADLAAHIAEVQTSWAAVVRAADPSGPSEDQAPLPLRTATRALLDALRAAGPESPAWVWWPGGPFTAGAIARHQVQEAALHRWDAESATGKPAPLEPAAAADGVAEFCVTNGRSPWNEPAAAPGGTVVLAPPGAGELWVIRTADGRLETGHVHVLPDDADAVLAGSPGDLVLALYRRLPLDAVSISGDRGVAEAVLAAIRLD